MANYIVTCVEKADTRFSDCRCVTRIGLVSENGGWTGSVSREDAYNIVSQGQDRLWVPRGRDYVEVVAAHRDATRYVRTEPDDTTADNLLQRPNCT